MTHFQSALLRPGPRSGALALLGILVLLAFVACSEGVSGSDFATSVAAFVVPTAPGVTVEVLATVGDRMPGSGESFAPFPDGIGIWSDSPA